MINIMQLVKRFNLIGEREQSPTDEQLLQEWSQNPEHHFVNYRKQPLDWITVPGGGAMAGYSDSVNYSFLPDITCVYVKGKNKLKIGWIQRIAMYDGGVVRIDHFAITTDLVRTGVGKTFLAAMVRFFKKMNAVSIEFKENHSTKIAHYRRFFEKHGVEEIEEGVWRIELYEKDNIPNAVLEFQKSLMH